MIPLSQLSAVSAELAGISPYPNDNSPPSVGEVTPALLQALAQTSERAYRFEAAVLVGSQAGSLTVALHRAVPSIRKILLVETDPRMIRTLAERLNPAPPHFPPLADTFVAHVEVPQVGYSTDAYLECAQFFLDQKIPLANTFYYVHESSAPRPEPIIAALDDLFYAQSKQFLGFFAEGDIPAELFVAWAGFLASIGEPFHALRFYEKLEGLVDRSALAETMIRCWIPTQCFEAIQEWTSHLDSEDKRAHFRAELHTCLAEKQETESECFQANVAALRAEQPELAAKLCAHQPKSPHWHAFIADVPWLIRLGGATQRAQYPVLFEERDQKHCAVNLPRNPHYLRSVVAESWKKKDSMDAIVIGSTKKPELLFAALINEPSYNLPNWRQAVYVIETDLDYFHHLLHAIDLTQFFEETRIRWFVGTSAIAELVHFLDGHPDRLTPMVHFDTTSEIICTLQTFEKQRLRQASELCQELICAYDDTFLRQSREVLRGRGDRPIRVFIQTSIFTEVLQYSARDMRDAFESLGAQVYLSHEASGLDRGTALTTLRELLAFRPDVVVLLDHLRSSCPFPLPKDLPIFTWIQDDLPHLAAAAQIRLLGPADHVYGVCGEFVDKFRSLGYPRISLLGMAANPRVYSPDASLPPPTNEVAFITHMRRVPEPAHLPGLFDWLRAYLKGRDPGERYALCTEALLLEGCDALGLTIGESELATLTSVVRLQLQREVHRLEVLSWLTEAGIPLGVYGKGWAEHPEFRTYARAPLSQGRSLCQAYQTAKVILHVNSTLNCHQRVFECLAAGGFVAARACPTDTAPEGLSSHLVIGKEISVFANRDELLAIVERAFHDEPWRQQMIQAGQQRVLSQHTYAHRMQRVLYDLKYALERRANPQDSALLGEERVAP